MSATVVPKRRMTSREFLAWAETQAEGRYELVDGEVVAMAPERIRHNLVKFAVARALRDAVRSTSLPCTVFTDGVSVVINDEITREPDASVQCGVTPELDALAIETPLIVVEVASPTSERSDLGARLVEYFSISSIRHYVVVVPDKRSVIHHLRAENGNIATRIIRDGDLVLKPPGIAIHVPELFAEVDR